MPDENHDPVPESSVRYPNFRQDLKEYLDFLSDPDLQRKYWIEYAPFEGREGHDFDMFIHFWYDDMLLDEGPEKLLGVILKSPAEYDYVALMTQQMELMFEELGLKAEPAEYLNSTPWKRVVVLAQDGRKLFVD